MIVKHRKKVEGCEGCCTYCDGVGEFNTGARPQDIEDCDVCCGQAHKVNCPEWDKEAVVA